MAGKRNFEYRGLEYLTMEPSERPYYCVFEIVWRRTGEVLADIITHRDFKGRWVRDYNTATYTHYVRRVEYYRQVTSPSGYSLPPTAKGVKAELKERARQQVQSKLDSWEWRKQYVKPKPLCRVVVITSYRDPETGRNLTLSEWDEAYRLVQNAPDEVKEIWALRALYSEEWGD